MPFLLGGAVDVALRNSCAGLAERRTNSALKIFGVLCLFPSILLWGRELTMERLVSGRDGGGMLALAQTLVLFSGG